VFLISADITNAPPGGELEAEVQYGAHRFPGNVSLHFIVVKCHKLEPWVSGNDAIRY